MSKGNLLLGFRSILYGCVAVFSYLYLAYAVMLYIFTERYESIEMVLLCSVYVVAYGFWDSTGNIIRWIRVKFKEGIYGK